MEPSDTQAAVAEELAGRLETEAAYCRKIVGNGYVLGHITPTFLEEAAALLRSQALRRGELERALAVAQAYVPKIKVRTVIRSDDFGRPVSCP